MQLNQRAQMFSNIIATCVCTDFTQTQVDLESGMLRVMDELRLLKKTKNTLYIVGNGGSAAVASHALVDFANVAKINAQVLHEPSLLTCMANDFGYENAYAQMLSQFIKPDDVLIAISSSGQSANICQGVVAANQSGAKVITFSGFDQHNRLRSLGDINFWLNSNDYGFVEVGHQFILHNLADRFGLESQNETSRICVEMTID